MSETETTAWVRGWKRGGEHGMSFIRTVPRSEGMADRVANGSYVTADVDWDAEGNIMGVRLLWDMDDVGMSANEDSGAMSANEDTGGMVGRRGDWVECPYCVEDGRATFDTRMPRSQCGICGGSGRFYWTDRGYDTTGGQHDSH